MLSTDQIAQQVVNQLRLLDPTASAEIGTPERKIIEAVAEMIAESQVDFSVLDSQHDIDSMSGGRLDAFLGNFGFARQQPVAATGIVTFSRSTSASADIVIPTGTQVKAQTDNPAFADVLFALTDTVTLALGQVSVDATVQATTPGTIGNVAANTISSFAGVATVSGINSISNADATSGGEDAETDEELKVRFKNTIFRNMVGTYDNYMSLAVALPNVTKANVIGAVSRYQEYVTIPGPANDVAQATCLDDGTHNGSTTGYDPVVASLIWPHKRTTAVSTNPYSQYVYDQNAYITNGNLGPDATFYRRDVDYVFNRIPRSAGSGSFQTINSGANALHQPNLTFLKTAPTDATANPDIVGDGNTTLLMEYAYISTSSRNNIALGITNAVDVFINGEDIQDATSQEVMPGAENKLHSVAPTTNWTYQDVTNPNYKRKLDSVASAVGNVLVPLYFEPVTDVPDSITMKNQTDSKPYTFYKANFKKSNVYYFDDPNGNNPRRASYLMVEEVNGYYGTTRARNGIEWLAIQPNASTKSNGYAANSNGTLVLQDSNTKANPLDTGFIGQQFKCDYSWDQNVGSAQTIMDANKQITADVLVHRARKRYFQVNVTIMYSIGVNKSAVNAGILATLDSFYSTQFYGAAIQLSDILQAVHNVPGVDNVRWTNETPTNIHPETVKVEEVQANGDTFASRGPHQYKNDFFIGDDTLAAVPTPLSAAANIIVRAANTWTS